MPPVSASSRLTSRYSQAIAIIACAIRAAIERARIPADAIEEGIFGCVLPAGVKQGPARQAMRQAGIPDHRGATTINKLCGSGMKATMLAHDLIKAGTAEVMLAWFWSLLTPRVPLLSALHLQETPRYRATYRGGGGVVVRLAELAE